MKRCLALVVVASDARSIRTCAATLAANPVTSRATVMAAVVVVTAEEEAVVTEDTASVAAMAVAVMAAEDINTLPASDRNNEKLSQKEGFSVLF